MKIVLTTHGDLAEGLLDSYRMIAGNTDNIIPINLTDDGIGVFSKKLRTTLDNLIDKEKVLILCDLKGGTPYNESLKYQLENEGTVEIVTGVNLPMLMETALSIEHSDLKTLKELAMNSGISAIQEENLELSEDDFDLEF